MEPVAFMEEVVLDPSWRRVPTVDLGADGLLDCVGEDVVVFLKLRRSLSAGRLFSRHCRVGTLAAGTANRLRQKLQSGHRYKVRVSDLPFPVNGSGTGLRISIWMEADSAINRIP